MVTLLAIFAENNDDIWICDAQQHIAGVSFTDSGETDQVCQDRMKRMIAQMAEAEGINEKLKASDQLGWISRMNSIRHRVEEIVLDELVFG